MLNLTFFVTPDEANLIGQALGELPYKQVGKLIPKLQAQAAAQEAAAKHPAPVTPPVPAANKEDN